MPSFFDDRPFREASQWNGFSGNVIERWSEGRDEASLADALKAAGSGFYLFSDDRAVLQAAGDNLQALFATDAAERAGLDPASRVLLGVVPAGPRFAALLLPDAVLGAGLHAVDLRTLATEARLPAADIAAIAYARSYLFWHAANRFCARCGGPLAVAKGGASRICATCATEHFPRVDPVVIMLAVDGDRCLLGRQPRFAPGMYSALAGFLEPGENIEESVRRETREEAGISIGRVAYHSSQAWPFPSSLMIGCHAEALSTDIVRDAAELEDCRWFARDEVRLMMAASHPQALVVPPKMAIAHSLVAAFAEWPWTG